MVKTIIPSHYKILIREKEREKGEERDSRYTSGPKREKGEERERERQTDVPCTPRLPLDSQAVLIWTAEIDMHTHGSHETSTCTMYIVCFPLPLCELLEHQSLERLVVMTLNLY